MRFMVMVKGTEDTEAGVMPTEQELAEMGKFNEQLVKAGVMLAAPSEQSTKIIGDFADPLARVPR